MADVELLPLPEPGMLHVGEPREWFTADQMHAYSDARVAQATEPLRAEVERLRRLVQERDTMLGKRLCAGANADGKPRCLALAEEHARAERLRAEAEHWRHKAAVHQYRRERLAEALRLIESAKGRGFGIDYARGVAQSALLRDQED